MISPGPPAVPETVADGFGKARFGTDYRHAHVGFASDGFEANPGLGEPSSLAVDVRRRQRLLRAG